jgi:F0F1-type ATP synthase assembly protein I
VLLAAFVFWKQNHFDAPVAEQQTKRGPVAVFIATTVMVSFISFWRAAAIVRSDLASSAYYAGREAEKVIGKSALWLVGKRPRTNHIVLQSGEKIILNFSTM